MVSTNEHGWSTKLMWKLCVNSVNGIKIRGRSERQRVNVVLKSQPLYIKIIISVSIHTNFTSVVYKCNVNVT